MIPDLPNVNIKRNVEQFIVFFENPELRADGLKIYKTLVCGGAELYELWKTGRYKSSSFTNRLCRKMCAIRPCSNTRVLGWCWSIKCEKSAFGCFFLFYGTKNRRIGLWDMFIFPNRFPVDRSIVQVGNAPDLHPLLQAELENRTAPQKYQPKHSIYTDDCGDLPAGWIRPSADRRHLLDVTNLHRRTCQETKRRLVTRSQGIGAVFTRST